MPNRQAQCRNCRHFRNDPHYIETVFKGLSSLSSGFASVRNEDGLCLEHDRYLSANAWCDRFEEADGSQATEPETSTRG